MRLSRSRLSPLRRRSRRRAPPRERLGVAITAVIDEFGVVERTAQRMNERGALAVIPSTARRNPPIPHDAELNKWRHLIENCFQRLKEFRRIAIRHHKTDASFAAAIQLVGAFLALR